LTTHWRQSKRNRMPNSHVQIGQQQRSKRNLEVAALHGKAEDGQQKNQKKSTPTQANLLAAVFVRPSFHIPPSPYSDAADDGLSQQVVCVWGSVVDPNGLQLYKDCYRSVRCVARRGVGGKYGRVYHGKVTMSGTFKSLGEC
jgi:hypothetical protein